MSGLLLPLAVDIILVFFAAVVVVAIVTIAGVIITHTTDVDAMADPTPRLGEVPGPYEHRGAYSSTNGTRPPQTFRITEVFSGETRDVPMPCPQVPPDVMARIDNAPWPDRSEWGQS